MISNDAAEAPAIAMNARQKLFIGLVDLAILTELCIAMARASSVQPELFTATFMKTFFLMFLPTLALGFFGFRRLRRHSENS
ncbi:hypothetical protein SAMN04488503_2348 [Humidesulfovibrio mexicanus]|uniref:Uncharacterized protein n=1 Tax=Humidesulfovibrio mexicanus TaxID=147047 RepID=A0A239B2E4_9BACT|nr:hypothetical protein [Humidesulfovibrio mexicanus]SNS01373.1 hypothetical protein SAMN04488503_2348 [Humidesulfovibrio mexicanus]